MTTIKQRQDRLIELEKQIKDATQEQNEICDAMATELCPFKVGDIVPVQGGKR